MPGQPDGDSGAIVDRAVSSSADGSAHNAEWEQYTRDEWVRAQMLLAEPQYTSIVPTQLFVGTWNVNGKKPDPDKVVPAALGTWLCGGAPGVAAPELVVVGFQEMVDLTAVNVASGAKSGERSAAWQAALAAALRGAYPGTAYQLVAAKHLVGILQLVYVRGDCAAHVRGVQSLSSATGIGGVLGNKGAVATRLRYHDCSLCFVCAHLAAHRENVAGRNADYNTVLGKTMFRDRVEAKELLGRGGGAAAAAVRRASQMSEGAVAEAVAKAAAGAGGTGAGAGGGGGGGAGGGGGPDDGEDVLQGGGLRPVTLHAAEDFGILDHDFVLWLGDLNYRLTMDVYVTRLRHSLATYSLCFIVLLATDSRLTNLPTTCFPLTSPLVVVVNQVHGGGHCEERGGQRGLAALPGRPRPARGRARGRARVRRFP